MEDTTEVEFSFSDLVLADEAKGLLGEGEGQLEDVEVAGILPIVGAVIAGAIAAAAVTKIVTHIIQTRQCQQIIDARSGKVEVTVNCEIRNGRIIFIADKDQQLVVTEVPDVFNATDVAKQALTEGASVAKAAIEAAGGKAEVEETDDDSEMPSEDS